MTSNCRFCDTSLSAVFLDLGNQPSANRFLTKEQAEGEDEPLFPLTVRVCSECFLVQLEDTHKPEEIFTSEYVYYSSYAGSWVDHARRYTEKVVDTLSLDSESFVVEIGSNDGYLLQHLVGTGIRCLGIDPVAELADAAKGRGVETLVDFFNSVVGAQVAATHGKADLIVGNNVFAHVPTVNDFVAGIATLLAPDGIVTLEFPHLARLIKDMQFDTIYDEHVFYFSLGTARRVLRRHGLEIFNVEKLPTHGGSLRIYGRHQESSDLAITDLVERVLADEAAADLDSIDGYKGFGEKSERIRRDFLEFVDNERTVNSSIAAFGAAAKGNTFLNYCGVGRGVIEFVADDTPAKQGKFLPGTHIPVLPATKISETKPDVILILPWNVADEIREKLAYTHKWGARLVTCIPKIRID